MVRVGQAMCAAPSHRYIGGVYEAPSCVLFLYPHRANRL